MTARVCGGWPKRTVSAMLLLGPAGPSARRAAWLSGMCNRAAERASWLLTRQNTRRAEVRHAD